MLTSILDNLYALKFLKLIVQDWKHTDAYRLGIVDATGKILKKQEELKSEDEKKALDKFTLLVFNVKRLLEKLPGARTLIGRYATALALVKEDADFLDLAFNIAEEIQLTENFELEILPFFFKEDTSTAGIDMGSGGGGYVNGEKGSYSFAGTKVFDAHPEIFHRSRMGKTRYARYKTFVGEDDIGKEIRDYGRKNPKHAIILKNSSTGAMVYLKRGKNINV